MNLQDWITAHTGKTVSFPNCLDNECMTLMHSYCKGVLRIDDPLVLAQPYAYQVYANFPNVSGNNYFALVANTPTNVPSAGDIMVFKQSAETPVGHVCVFVSGDVMSFTSFDSNYPAGSLPHLQLHKYDNVAGWLHPLSLPQTETVSIPNPQQTEDAIRQDRDRWWNALNDVCAAFGITPDPANIDATVQQVKDKVQSYQANITSLTVASENWKEKYDTESSRNVALNQANEEVSSENQDNGQKALDAERALTTMTDLLHAISDNLHIQRTSATNDSQLAEEVLEEVSRLQKAQPKEQPTHPFSDLVDLLNKYGLNDFLVKNNVSPVDLLTNPTDPKLQDKLVVFLTHLTDEYTIFKKQFITTSGQAAVDQVVKTDISQATQRLVEVSPAKKNALLQGLLSIFIKTGLLQASA